MRHLVISTKFQQIPSQFPHFTNFRYNSGNILTMRKKLQQEVSPTKLFQIHRDKSKVSLFLRDRRYSDA